ncbi:hypothetical protein HF888_05545 [Bermanella marisrubri]|uniref:Lipoprotein n=1 Tax=Bermanella marisrubri TaxID=207949 RepID=Q1MY70_9GAMM|nr:hypothetical protein [Bermanella marisrubri]EAT10940.1 hypothetical protein RED65_02433 [Oceanobacter sp. RED65] [Bermanella marisrubri]QIZ83717.1 hypothetical protein HF888_05545 [Bermanella marisrubri]
MKNLLKSALGTALIVSMIGGLTACFDESSSSPTNPNSTSTLSGIVTDPAISGSKVRLDDLQGNALASILTTDKNGEFAFDFATENLPSSAMVSASGGHDTQTGLDFTGITLKAVVESKYTVVSPLTTLVVEEMEDSDSDYSSTVETIAKRFNLTPSQVVSDPTQDTSLQKLSIQLSMLATALRTDDGFDRVEQLIEENGVVWSDIASEVNSTPDISVTAQARVTELVNELQAIDQIENTLSAQESLEEVNRLSIVNGVTRFLEEQLAFTANDDVTTANIVTLAESLWKANDKQGLASDSLKFANLVRYVFSTAQITTADLESADFELNASMLSNIADIAALNVIDHTIPLGTEEKLTSSDAKRDYFYQSDLSPAYQAIKLFNSVSDDNIIDPTFVNIAKTYAEQGMLDEANVILKSQIAMPFYQAKANLFVGNVLLEQKGSDVAKAYWDTAASILSDYLSSKGYLNMDQADAALIDGLASAYREAGFSSEADATITPVNNFIAENAGAYSVAYYILTFSFSNKAKELVEAAEAANFTEDSVRAAKASIDLFANINEGVGAQSSANKCDGADYFKARTFNYPKIAEYYIRIGDTAGVQATVDKFEGIRAEECTAQQTIAYVDDMASVYGYLGTISDYIDMVNNDTSLTQTYIDRSLSAAAIYQALDLAKTANEADSDNVADAITMVSALYPDDQDASDLASRITYLTNNGINESDPSSYLGLKLLKQNYLEEGAQVFTAAWEIATSDTFINGQLDNGTQLTRYGCSKIARITYQRIDQSLGQSRMNECATILANFETEGATSAVSEAYTYLASDALTTGLDSLAQQAFEKAIAYASLLNDEERVDAVRAALLYPIESGLLATGVDISAITTPLDELTIAFNDTAEYATTQEEIKNAANLGIRTLGAYANVVHGLRAAATEGVLLTDQADTVNAIQTEASALLLEVFALIQTLADADDREDVMNYAFGIGNTANLKWIGIFDTLASLIESMQETESQSLINGYRAELANQILNADAFEGEDLAKIDQDNDGLPDFFTANASAEDIMNSRLIEDSNVDGDNVNDSMDSTPFYAEI